VFFPNVRGCFSPVPLGAGPYVKRRLSLLAHHPASASMWIHFCGAGKGKNHIAVVGGRSASHGPRRSPVSLAPRVSGREGPEASSGTLGEGSARVAEGVLNMSRMVKLTQVAAARDRSSESRCRWRRAAEGPSARAHRLAQAQRATRLPPGYGRIRGSVRALRHRLNERSGS